MERMAENDLPLPLKVARGAAYALWSLAKSTKNKYYIQKAGGLSLLVKLVRTKNISVIIPAKANVQRHQVGMISVRVTYVVKVYT